jgi:hypothetical protein
VPRKSTYAGTVSRSFAEAGALLEQRADRRVSAKHVERVARRIGAERLAERNAAGAGFQTLPLVEKFTAPAGGTPPALAVVRGDGGRLQILDRTAPAATANAVSAPAPADAATPAETEAWDEAKASSGHWREDKGGLLLTRTSDVATVAPCPEVPPSFLDATRLPERVRELNKHVKPSDATASEAAGPEAPAEALREETVEEPPEVQQRKGVAARERWPAFAPLLAAAAWAWGVQGAARKAFVGDGSANNWKLQRRCFGSFEPILDFLHALS